jgi:hypothetical protein
MREYLPDHRGVFDTGDDAHRTSAFNAGCHIDKVN